MTKVDNYTKFNELFNICRNNYWFIKSNEIMKIAERRYKNGFARIYYYYPTNVYFFCINDDLSILPDKTVYKQYPTYSDIEPYLQSIQVSLFDLETSY